MHEIKLFESYNDYENKFIINHLNNLTDYLADFKKYEFNSNEPFNINSFFVFNDIIIHSIHAITEYCGTSQNLGFDLLQDYLDKEKFKRK